MSAKLNAGNLRDNLVQHHRFHCYKKKLKIYC
uniref:Uncharacterized protein n=1 Tax=Solanum lycopersicum TaxID=4081 RepID=K4CQG3_SOLLC